MSNAEPERHARSLRHPSLTSRSALSRVPGGRSLSLEGVTWRSAAFCHVAADEGGRRHADTNLLAGLANRPGRFRCVTSERLWQPRLPVRGADVGQHQTKHPACRESASILIKRHRYLCQLDRRVARVSSCMSLSFWGILLTKDSFFEYLPVTFTRKRSTRALAEIDRLPGRHLYFLRRSTFFGDRRFATALFDCMRGIVALGKAAGTVNGCAGPGAFAAVDASRHAFRGVRKTRNPATVGSSESTKPSPRLRPWQFAACTTWA